MTDTLLKQNAVKCLIVNFDIVQTERFISLVIKEPFDYTEWQKDLFDNMTTDELFDVASIWKQSKLKN